MVCITVPGTTPRPISTSPFHDNKGYVDAFAVDPSWTTSWLAHVGWRIPQHLVFTLLSHPRRGRSCFFRWSSDTVQLTASLTSAPLCGLLPAARCRCVLTLVAPLWWPEQKGGTTNLRRNLLTHPLVTGMPNEVHFFDQDPDM